jgi:methylase of polypeptide subunit release factors
VSADRSAEFPGSPTGGAPALDAIERTVALDRAGSPLDLACGTGEVSLALSDRVAEIWAIDLEPETVAEARRNPGRRRRPRPS